MLLDIAQEADLVMYLDANGYDYQREQFRNLGFKRGDRFTVNYVDIGGFSSTYGFAEISNQLFNTVMFTVLHKMVARGNND